MLSFLKLLLIAFSLLAALVSAVPREPLAAYYKDPQHPSCKGGGEPDRVNLDFNKVPKKCKDLPHTEDFKFERDGIDFFNFAPMQYKLFDQSKAADLDKDQWIAALGSSVDTSGRVTGNSTAYISLRPKSKAQFFHLYNMKFFCLRNLAPFSCSVGFRASKFGDSDWNEIKNSTDFFYNATSGEPARIVFDRETKYSWVSLGIPNAKSQNPNDYPDSEIVNDDDTSGEISAYLYEIEYSTPKCKPRTPDHIKNGIMDRQAKSC